MGPEPAPYRHVNRPHMSHFDPERTWAPMDCYWGERARCAFIGAIMFAALRRLGQEIRGMTKPNIVFILVDNVGWGNFGVTAGRYPRRASTSWPARAFASTTTT